MKKMIFQVLLTLARPMIKVPQVQREWTGGPGRKSHLHKWRGSG